MEMNGMSSLQMMPISLWIIAAATCIMIVLLALSMYLFYRKRLQAMEPLNTDVGDLINQKQQLEADIDSIKDWVANQKDELIRLEAERKEQEIIRSEIQRLEQEATKKEEDNKSLRDEVGSLENQRHMLVQSIEKSEQEKFSLQKEINTLGNDAEESKKKLKEIDVKLDEYIKEEKRVKEVIANLNVKIDVLEKQIKSLDAEIEDKKNSLKVLTQERYILEKDIEEKRHEQKKRESELQRLNKSQMELSAEVRALINKRNSIEQMPKEAFDSLNQPVFNVPDSEREVLQENEALEELNQLIIDSGFEIPRRLQYAFHTSLKTSDISCLTVMAGVSGTGKSAFPKLYAQSMGLYFLPLAVEPRWDSPQDLFGFLNYMENRFESTKLARSLVQFNNSPYADIDHANMQNRILLVLLDEMNLARIEYYFSEFLSKLEMRRNVNIHNEDDYRIVSTEIYAGRAGDEEKEVEPSDPMYLYAGSNILFVGTMNEDETTQSLSDKVIDRANVLYFGKPEQLMIQRQNIDLNKNWAPININTWNKWIVEPNETTIIDFDFIDNLLNNLNTTLADLGRPFGWRTYKAMMTYIANHPTVNINNDSGKKPLSDQVAMRIMPKLRGLDLTEYADVFNHLGIQLSTINDDALTEAFRKAQNSAIGFFDWRGIQW